MLLMRDSGGSSEDQNANRNADSKDCVHEISDGSKGTRLEAIHITFWQRSCLHFCSFPKSLWDTEFEGDRQVNMAVEISRPPSIQAVAWILLMLLSRLIVRIGARNRAKGFEKSFSFH
jgi:hypothetical protein